MKEVLELSRTKDGFSLEGNIIPVEYLGAKILYYSSNNPTAMRFNIQRQSPDEADYYTKSELERRYEPDQILNSVLIEYYRLT